jgi:hypothetical protein
MHRILGALAGLAGLVLNGCCGGDVQIKIGEGEFQGYHIQCEETKTPNSYERKLFIRDVEDPTDDYVYDNPTMKGASEPLWNEGREVWTTLLVYNAPDGHPFRKTASFETLDAAYDACWATE